MPNYRGARVPGGTFFFTVVTHGRRELFHLEANRKLLGDARLVAVGQANPWNSKK